VPWVHNVRNTNFVAAIDDEQCLSLLRLCNEPAGRQVLREAGVPQALVDQLPLLGISSLCNLVAAIKTARHYDLGSRDLLFTPLTDSAEMYASRLVEMTAARGAYTREHALVDHARWLLGCVPDHVRELSYLDRKTLHNFKYFTWVEQQGRTVDELRRLWDPDFWAETYDVVEAWDRRIDEFNARVGLGDG
jgi:cysteine synthase